MLLERIDIDAHGPLNRVELGPFSEHLNVVCGPEGSGKTAIARFIRDSLVERDYPLGMMSSSSGRVVWADRNGLLHCRREQDGSKQGRRSVEYESRGVASQDSDFQKHAWLNTQFPSAEGYHSSDAVGGYGRDSDATRALHSIQLPEAIVDAVITDTAITHVARVVSACLRSGLDSRQTYRGLPLDETTPYSNRDGYTAQQSSAHEEHRRSLRAQLADVEMELARIEPDSWNEPALLARRDELTNRLNRRPVPRSESFDELERADRQLQAFCDRANHLRARQSELRRWVADLDAQLRTGDVPHRDEVTGNYQQHWAIRDESLRRELDDLDAQMIRWRRALLEVRGLRDAILATRQSFRKSGHVDFVDHGPQDAAIQRRRRLDGFLDAIDRFDASRGWKEFYSDSPFSDDLYHASRVRDRAEIQASQEGRVVDPIHSLDHLEQRVESATRQIDWLLQRYASSEDLSHDWYRAARESTAFGGTTLAETLRTIRNDLVHASRHAVADKLASVGVQSLRAGASDDLRELHRSEQWLVSAIEQLMQHREAIFNRYTPTEMKETQDWARQREVLHWRYQTERAERLSELDRTSRELEACLAEAARLRRDVRADQPRQNDRDDAIAREAMLRERQQIDGKLSNLSRVRWLRDRAEQLRDQLRVVHAPIESTSPLAQTASRWLVRLSGGRLRHLSWRMTAASNTIPHNPAVSNRVAASSSAYGDVHGAIDGRDESACSLADRGLAVMAVRMAAGELLARLGKPVPLVLETARSLVSSVADHPQGSASDANRDSAFYHHSGDGRFNHPVASALRDYATSGRQILLLTSDRWLTEQIARSGGRTFTLRADRVVHAHRPVWRPHYAPERYHGPHPHTYGDQIVGDPSSYRSREFLVNDINRDFDMAWRETYGLYDHGDARHPQPTRAVPTPGHVHSSSIGDHTAPTPRTSTDTARGGDVFRDGYYYADAYTTAPPPAMDATVVPRGNGAHRDRSLIDSEPLNTLRRSDHTEPAFFLTVDSPIDQAPSIDAVAAARLRGLQVTHITHLMQQDANRLSDALGLASVDAATIRRWKSECRLVCRVPKLRGFDARVLVGCGVTDPAQLASIHPTDLLQRVEDFLATEQGQRVLLSGSSRELSRITSWIAAANSWGAEQGSRYVDGRAVRKSAQQDRRANENRGRSRDRQNLGDDSMQYAGIRYGIRPIGGETRQREGIRVTRGRPLAGRSTLQMRNGEGSRRRRSGLRRSDSGSSESRSSQSRSTQSRSSQSSGRDVVRMEPREGERSERASRESRSERENRMNREPRDSENELRFYLQRDSPVVDAPSIGPRMADRLNRIGVYSVDDLLNADPDALAEQLRNRRIDGETILSWQQQATLVCRIPMLRGHDAQLLVASDITAPEELAIQDPADLFGRVDPVSRSREGKRILRSGKLPDLEEVTQWIAYAKENRELVAA